MTDFAFWRTTPAKLNLLSEVHAKFNSPAQQRTLKYVDEAGFEI